MVGWGPEHRCCGEAGGERGWVAEVMVALPGDDQDFGADVAEAGTVFNEGHLPHRRERTMITAQAGDAFAHHPGRAGQRGDIVGGQVSGNLLPHAGIEAQDAVSDTAEDDPADARVACTTRSPIIDPTEYPAKSTWSSPR
jgi:hypothetical protein